MWFALDESQPLAVRAGLWTGRTGTLKLAEGKVVCNLFAFLTTDASTEVGAIYHKTMPVTLTERDEIEMWLTAPRLEASGLQ